MTELNKINDPKSCLKVKNHNMGVTNQIALFAARQSGTRVLLTKSPGNICAVHNSYEIAEKNLLHENL